MPAVALGILYSRCGDGGPRIERTEHGASSALVLFADFREGEEYKHLTHFVHQRARIVIFRTVWFS